MRALFIVLGLVLFAQAGHASEKQVFELKNGHRIAAEIDRGSRGAFVLLNGLVYAISRWDEVASGLSDAGYTVIRMSYVAQPESLRLLQANEEPGFFKTGLELKTLAEDLKETLDLLGTENPVTLVGLSYGSSVATEFALRYPAAVDQLVLMSPLVVSLETYDSSGLALRKWLDDIRHSENLACDLYGAVNPYLCAFRDHLYDTYYSSIFGSYLEKRIKDVPSDLDPAVYKKSIFHLVRAARDFNLKDAAKNLKNVHVLVASEDDKPLREDQERVWNLLPASERRSHILFKGAHHALPDEAPTQVIDALTAIAEKSPEVMSGKKLEVNIH